MANVETEREEHKRECLEDGSPFCDRWCRLRNGDVWRCDHGLIVKHSTADGWHSLKTLRNQLGSRREYRRALEAIQQEGADR